MAKIETSLAMMENSVVVRILVLRSGKMNGCKDMGAATLCQPSHTQTCRCRRTRPQAIRDCLRSGSQEHQYDAATRNGIHRDGVERVPVVSPPHRLRTVVLDGICNDRPVCGEGSGCQESLA
ncbi:hypothetical protein GN958_ATG16033 [Phytophthora infestans]|uniref:Uncharacterized protein n=1 Tax=Phytophthora infestans TaxID=4787 RepID=A0A8S9U5S3_PHYIN|nr:hypothetical protein GN958_ATG16033 [Phytophthora infestans]